MRLFVCALTLVPVLGCSGSDAKSDDGTCPGVGTVELSGGSHQGIASVKTFSGSANEEFSLEAYAQPCSGDISASFASIPAALGTHELTVLPPGGYPPNALVIVGEKEGFSAGFNMTIGCDPCGSGTVTVTSFDAAGVAGTFDFTAWKYDGPASADPNTTLKVSGSFQAHFPQ